MAVDLLRVGRVDPYSALIVPLPAPTRQPVLEYDVTLLSSDTGPKPTKRVSRGRAPSTQECCDMLVGPMQYVSNPKHSDPWQRGDAARYARWRFVHWPRNSSTQVWRTAPNAMLRMRGKHTVHSRRPRTFGMDIPSGGSMFQCESARLGAVSVA